MAARGPRGPRDGVAREKSSEIISDDRVPGDCIAARVCQKYP